VEKNCREVSRSIKSNVKVEYNWSTTSAQLNSKRLNHFFVLKETNNEQAIHTHIWWQVNSSDIRPHLFGGIHQVHEA
jgi:hypothetical protein